MQNPPLLESPVFILGVQRSGTTWLANIFDASPETLLFMEPFAPPFELFPEFPDPSYFLSHSSPYLNHFLRSVMAPRLLRHKALCFSRSTTDPTWFRLERALVRGATRARPFLPDRLQKRLRKFRLLNLNRMDEAGPLYPKSRSPSTWVIKELRFAGKIPVLREAFPEARFVVIMRHPCATVHSILKWFRRGRLGELRHALDTYLEKIEAQVISRPYEELIPRCRRGDPAHLLALYWRISYETMFRQLKRSPSALFISYEQLATRPHETAKELFERAGLSWTSSVEEYLSKSTSTKVEDPGAITTVRESGTYYRQWTRHISKATREAVMDMTGDSSLLAEFEPYYNHAGANMQSYNESKNC